MAPLLHRRMRRSPLPLRPVLAVVLLVGLVAGIPGTVAGPPAAAAPAARIVDRIQAERPRLVADEARFDEVRNRILVTKDPTSVRWYADLKAAGDAMLGQPPVAFDDYLLDDARTVRARAHTLGFLHQVDGDPKYATRLWEELDTVSGFADWEPETFLATAEMTGAVAVGYDWIHSALDSAQKARLRDAITGKGLREGIEHYEGRGEGTQWVRESDNWNIVSNGGLALGALAVGDSVDSATQATAEKVLQYSLVSAGNGESRGSIEYGLGAYAPDGGYPEGTLYWGYATRYLVPYIASLRSAVGDDYGLSDAPGVASTAGFGLHMSFPKTGAWNYGDAENKTQDPPETLWFANHYDPADKNSVYGWWGREGGDRADGSGTVSAQHLLWFDPGNVNSPAEVGLPKEKRYDGTEVFTARSAWDDPAALFTGLKGGDNQTSHGDLDLGAFALDAGGVHWATELGPDDYSRTGYYGYGPEGDRWTYYRKRAEGQNTLSFNPAADGPDQNPLATGDVRTLSDPDPDQSQAIADLSEAGSADGVTAWRRGVTLLGDSEQVVVQDEFKAPSRSVDVWWSMHTRASIWISGDGKRAVLTSGSQKLELRILRPTRGEVRFTARAAEPLTVQPVDPDGQRSNDGIRKLAIELADVRTSGSTAETVAVSLTPYSNGRTPAGPPAFEPLDQWPL